MFLDTSFIVALEMARDNHHKAAAAYWKTYVQKPMPLVTTDFVFAEIVTFFNTQGLHAKAIEIGDRLLNSHLVELLAVTPELRAEAWAMF